MASVDPFEKEKFTVIRNLLFLHPVAKGDFIDLATHLDEHAEEIGCHFRVFETFRHPMRQDYLRSLRLPQGVTNAGAFESAHQYGLAVDFVGFVDGVWTWDDKLPWFELDKAATLFGLKRPISWDRAHIEHPMFAEIKRHWRV